MWKQKEEMTPALLEGLTLVMSLGLSEAMALMLISYSQSSYTNKKQHLEDHDMEDRAKYDDDV